MEMAYKRKVYHPVLCCPEGSTAHDEAVLGSYVVNRAVFLRVWQDRCETHDVYSKGASPAQKLAAISVKGG